MKTTVFVPKELRIGYQERSDTYTGKLAYVIYIDDKGKLRKETSWNSWRDSDIPVSEIDNVPTAGFVLNKKVGDYNWGEGRRAWCRVFDPRGFEFEITIENLLYILENTSSIKGKGLEGDFVYGWDGSDLLLIPAGAPDYQAMVDHSATLFNKTTIKAKDLILGATYQKKTGEKIVYMGRYDTYEEYDRYYREENTVQSLKGRYYWFMSFDKGYSDSYTLWTWKSLGTHVMACLDDTPVSDYATRMEYVERQDTYSPVDKNADRFVPYDKDEFVRAAEKAYYMNFYDWTGRILSVTKESHYDLQFRVVDKKTKTGRISAWSGNTYSFDIRYATAEEIFRKYQPQHKDKYLTNGKFYQRET